MQRFNEKTEEVAGKIFTTYQYEHPKHGICSSIIVQTAKPKANTFFPKPFVWENYRTEEQRNKRVEELRKIYTEREQAKVARRKARTSGPNPAKVGDILVSSWGYEQTNVDFYEVTEVKGKMVTICEIASKTVPGTTYSHGMACEVVASKGAFIKGKQPMKKLVNKNVWSQEGREYSVRIESYTSAHLWDGKPCYSSWYA